jgi:signal transduction histidine kinase
MSIRFKVLLGLMVIFLLNLLILGAYYQFYLRDEVSVNLQNAHSSVEQNATLAANRLEKGGISEIASILSAEEFEKLDFVVTDVKTGEVLFQRDHPTGDLGIHASAVARPGSRLLLVDATWHFILGSVRAISVVQQVLVVEIIIIAALLALIAVVLRYGLLKPLTQLNQRMADYRQGKRNTVAVTRRRDEFGQLSREFEQLTSALDEEKRMQDRIVASISHDIKTPLTSVMGYVERLIKGNVKDEERVRHYLQTIYDRAQSINSLVADFDGYLASSAQTLKLKPVSAESLCGLIREEYGDELQSEGVDFALENTAGNAMFSGDLGKMRRVFGNLIGNAVRHSTPAGLLKIRISCHREGDMLRFSVGDNGVGVAPEEWEHIFEPFYTGDASRGEGSGLGLAICKSIVEAHSGRIHAEPSDQGGLLIVITLPVLPEKA